MSKLSYWERRQVENMYRYMQSAEDVADQIAKLYLRSSRWLTMAAEDIFERYMTKHNLSESEARRLLNELQDRTSIDEMMQKLKNGDTDGKKKELIAKLESIPYRARIERLKQLQNQLDRVMQEVYKQEKILSTAHYVDLANEAYYRTIYDLQQRAQAAFSFNYIDPEQIDAVVNSKWSGKNYSSRIWGNTKALAQDVKEELLINLVTGRTERETAAIFANKFAQGASNARRLVRTESAYLSAELSSRAIKEAGVEEYQYMATLDLKTSEICRKMDLQIFKVSDRKVGVNCPPMHPWCRSTIVAVVDRKYLEGKKRAAIDPETGERILVPRNMTYEEWYEKYVKGKTKAETAEKKLKNKSSDQKQHERYRKVLGDNVPDKLDDFQEMKYNDGEKWEYIKGLEEYLKKYPSSDKKYYDIQYDLKKNGIKQGLALPPVVKQAFIMPEGKKDSYHIMKRMIERNITDDMIRGYMQDAKCMFSQWNGQRQAFYGDKGVVVVTKSDEDWIYKTAWTADDFDEDTKTIMEVINKHVK